MTVRLAALADLPRIVEIYNQAIASRTATADTTPFTVEQRLDWFRAHPADEYPLYIYEENGQVLGWLSLSPYRGRPALRRTAEVSYYVDYASHGRGIGSFLMAHMLQNCPPSVKVLVAILLEWNTGSIKLLEKFGFERWGFLPDVAQFDDKVTGHLYYGRKV